MSQINGSSEEREDSDYVPSVVFEIQPMRWVVQGQQRMLETCTAEQAEEWAIFGRKVISADQPPAKERTLYAHAPDRSKLESMTLGMLKTAERRRMLTPAKTVWRSASV